MLCANLTPQKNKATRKLFMMMASASESVLDISAHKYGNYHKYYSFHPAESRMNIIRQYSLFHNIWLLGGKCFSFVATTRANNI